MPLSLKLFRALSAQLLTGLIFFSQPTFSQRVDVMDYGVKPNSGEDATGGVTRAIEAAKHGARESLIFPKGRYDFYAKNAHMAHYFISNHDHVDQRAVGMPFEGVTNLTVDGQGSEFVFHGVMLPISLVGTSGMTLKNFSIDFATQHFLFTKVLKSDSTSTSVEVLPNQKYTVKDGQLTLFAEDWTKPATVSVELDPKTMTLALNAHDDYNFKTKRVTERSAGILDITGMPATSQPGNILMFRSNDRPNPAIWASESSKLLVSHVTVYGAQGMAFIAQRSEDVHLDALDVRLPEGKGRLITTNADALHFSNCRGKLLIENGMYENMLDDGINVHASFLRVAAMPTRTTVLLEWGHFQAFGFTFAKVGERVEFASKRTLLPIVQRKVVAVARPDDHHVLITLDQPLPPAVKVDDDADNVDWRPSAIYRGNTVRRIRSRGVLFSTPAGVLIENNHFDKTSGAAILIPGEGSKWFEGTPSSDVIIRHNTITDSNIGRPVQAAIVIGPTIETPVSTDAYSHRNIVIEDNEFELLGKHMVQGLSVDGLLFRNNRLTTSTVYPQAKADKGAAFMFVHSKCIRIGANTLPFKLSDTDVSSQDVSLLNIEGLASAAENEAWNQACAAEVHP